MVGVELRAGLVGHKEGIGDVLLLVLITSGVRLCPRVETNLVEGVEGNTEDKIIGKGILEGITSSNLTRL